ncbi:hypothetical protein Droror1_Dr00020446 [Drosera rotundifolia]
MIHLVNSQKSYSHPPPFIKINLLHLSRIKQLPRTPDLPTPHVHTQQTVPNLQTIHQPKPQLQTTIDLQIVQPSKPRNRTITQQEPKLIRKTTSFSAIIPNSKCSDPAAPSFPQVPDKPCDAISSKNSFAFADLGH